MWESLVARLRWGRRVTLSALAGNSVLFRALPDAPTGRLADAIGTALDGTVGVVLGVAVTVTLADLRLVGVAFDAALYFYVVTAALPRFLPDEPFAKQVLGTRRFVLAASGLVLLLGFPLSLGYPVAFAASPLAIVSAATGIAVDAIPKTQLLLGWGVLVWVGIGLYVFRWWRTAETDTRARFAYVAVGRQSDLEEVRRELRRAGWPGLVANGMQVVAVSGIVTVLLLVFAILSSFVIVLFPLPELLVLAGVVAGALTRDRSSGRLAALAERRIDIEHRLFTVVRYIRTSRKGISVMGVILIGLLVSMLATGFSNFGLLLIAYSMLTNTGELAAIAVATPLELWVGMGVLLCTLVPGLYSLWFWVRQVERLPHYLVDWEQRHPGSAAIEDTELSPLRTRPYGNLLLPSLLFAPIAVAALMPNASRTVLVVLAVGCPVLLALIVYAVRRTHRRSPQPPATDGWAMPLAYTIQVGWLWLASPLLQDGFRTVELVAILVVGLGFYLLADATVWFENVDWDYSTAAFAATCGVVFLAGGAWAVRHQAGRTISSFALAAGLLLLTLATIATLDEWRLDD